MLGARVYSWFTCVPSKMYLLLRIVWIHMIGMWHSSNMLLLKYTNMAKAVACMALDSCSVGTGLGCWYKIVFMTTLGLGWIGSLDQ